MKLSKLRTLCKLSASEAFPYSEITANEYVEGSVDKDDDLDQEIQRESYVSDAWNNNETLPGAESPTPPSSITNPTLTKNP